MRLAALALVLIVGSAVVLAFANTLNSWVLGGLIGGLAALLLSIPISLILFTVLARRQDERLQAQALEQEEMGFIDYDDDYDSYVDDAEVYDADAYVLPSQEDYYEDYYNERIERRAPYMRGLPPAGQSQASASTNTRSYAQGYKHPSQALPAARENERGTASQQLKQRSPKQTRSLLAQHQPAALRRALREATQELDDVEVVSRPTSKRISTVRPPAPLSEQPTRSGQQPARESSQRATPTNRSQRGAESAYGPQRGARRSDTDSTDRAPRTDALYMHETETGQLRGGNPRTGPIHLNPQTGQIVRNPHLEEQSPSQDDVITGSLKNPLVRRPPYLYEDDPLRQELAQQLEGQPIKRRSSLFRTPGFEEVDQ